MSSFRLSPQGENTRRALETLAKLDGPCDRFRGGYAYITKTGVDALNQNLPTLLDNSDSQEWLTSIDSGVTQPAALRALCSQESSEVRVPNGEEYLSNASLEAESLFHPKFAWRTWGQTHDVVLGSANLTRRALYSNWEINVRLKDISSTENSESLSDLKSWWDSTWDKATVVDNSFIQEYESLRENYIERNPPSFLKQSLDSVSLPDAGVLWTEVDTVMGFNNHQIEVPLACSPYFSRESSEFADGDQVYVTFKFRGIEYEDRSIRGHPNQMCRINLPNEVGDQFELTNYSIIFDYLGEGKFKISLIPDDERDRILEPIQQRSEQESQIIEMPGKARVCGWV